MDKKKSSTSWYITIFVLGVVIALMLFYVFRMTKQNTDITFAPDMTVTDNPLMGFAPDARYESLCEETRLVYIELTWKDWEKEEGVFDIEGLEKNFHISKWKEENKHAVIRFVCDIPGTNDHYDIPEWVYNKTGDGTHYDSEYGKGYSPNYSNEVFKEYHKRAVMELADYCNRDDFVAFVELGSIGHWGEWHALDGKGNNIMPGADVCREYVSWYTACFEKAYILTRRNYDFTIEENIGLYNDMVGDEAETKEWLEWIKKGGIQETSGETLTLKETELGKQFPVGGEFGSSRTMNEILTEDFGDTLSLITSSKMTFIGPNVPDLTSKEQAVSYNSILRRMGYRIYVSGLTTRYDFAKRKVKATLSFRNAGNAGFYFNWPVTLHVYDKNLNEVYSEKLDLDLRELNAKEEMSADAYFPLNNDLLKEYYIGVSITDTDGDDYIELAIDDDYEKVYVGNTQIIYHYTKNNK